MFAARALVAVAALAVALLLAELAARLVVGDPVWPPIQPEPYVDNAVLYRPAPGGRLYELRPGVDEVVGDRRVRVHVNSAGFRDDREISAAKQPGVFRILVLGDSFTFAGKVPAAQTLPSRLEQMLAAASPERRFEVLNWGVPGYNTEQEMLLLRDRGFGFDPDLVIVAFFLNDADPPAQLVPKRTHLPLRARRALRRFTLVRLVYERVLLAAQARAKLGATFSSLTDGAPGWERARAALAEMARLSGERGTRLLVVIWPMLADLTEKYPFRAKHELVASACRSLGIPVVDLLPAFLGRDPDRLHARSNDQHPNALAQEIAAHEVLERLERDRLTQ